MQLRLGGVVVLYRWSPPQLNDGFVAPQWMIARRDRRGFGLLIDSVRGASEMLFHLVARWRRESRTTWGATNEEVVTALPGDELIQASTWGYTHAITIDASPAGVWPWLVQIGQGRGGFYSFELLENLAGCHIHNTDAILPEFQHLGVGDEVRLAPKGPPPLSAAIVAPEQCLALVGGAPGGKEPISLWSFHLAETDTGATRLVERGRYRVAASLGQRIMLGPTVLEPVSFVMSRQMLRTIKRLAESEG